MTSAEAPRQNVSRLQWMVLLLLVISVCINYIDRGNLSVASVAISAELGLRPSQLGVLLSGFFWTYAGFMILAGWLVDRYNVIWVYALGYLIWSAATAVTPPTKGRSRSRFGGACAQKHIQRALLLGDGSSHSFPVSPSSFTGRTIDSTAPTVFRTRAD